MAKGINIKKYKSKKNSDNLLRTNPSSPPRACGGGEGGQEEGVGGGQGWQGQFELAIYSHNLS